MAAKYQHLSPAFLSDAVKLLDGAYAESPAETEAERPEKPEAESPENAENGPSSRSIVTVALPEQKREAA
jgi:hypothetical protein